MTTAARDHAFPPAPTGVEATGLHPDLLSHLVLKTLYFGGELSGSELSKRLGLPFQVLEPSIEGIRGQRQCEVVGGAMVGGGSFRYRITDIGRSAAAVCLERSAYVGVAPVPLAHYRAYMTAQAGAGRQRCSPVDVREAFAHLVLDEEVLDTIGPAVNGNHSILVYGKPGNGKTAVALGLRNLLVGEMAVPHALEVEGNVIRVFDPLTHERVSEPSVQRGALQLDTLTDARWVRCRRPVVVTGGELTLDSLELSFDERVGIYRAPVQLAANGGLLVIDDFGRQRCSPRELLNRWMAPLESRADYLTLKSGLKFEIPSTMLVAFSTNIDPQQLVEEAFLRRVQYKLHVESPTPEQFIRIFEQRCLENDVAFNPTLPEQLITEFYRPRNLQLRGCHPRDLINHALLLAEYRGLPRTLTSDLLIAACRSYFVENEPQ